MKSWKTTLAGLFAGSVVLIPQIAHVISSNTGPGNQVDWSKVALGTGLIVIGALAKDHNVTGGTVGQPSTQQAIVDRSVVVPPK